MFNSSFSIRQLLKLPIDRLPPQQAATPASRPVYTVEVEEISSDETSSSSSIKELCCLQRGTLPPVAGHFQALPTAPVPLAAQAPPRFEPFPPRPAPDFGQPPRPGLRALQLYRRIRTAAFNEPISLSTLKDALPKGANVHSAIRELMASGQLARGGKGLYYRPMPCPVALRNQVFGFPQRSLR